jgi:hypothetical protein
VVVARFLHPVDAEWMVGSMRDAVERVRDGKQMYVRPSAEFIPFLYPPIYFWVSAALAHVVSPFVACKVVSLVATLVTAWGIARLATILGASRFWAAVAVLLHLGSYSLTLFFFDLERVDALAAAFVVVGLVVLLGGPGLGRAALGGALLGLAFFAKQPGILAFGAAVVGLFLAGERKRSIVALAVGGALFAVVLGYLELKTGGWFRYYCVKLPGTHGIEPALLSTFLVQDVPKAFLLAGATAAILAPFLGSAVRRRRLPEGVTANEVVFALVLAAGLAGAFSLRTHRGGWANVILAWTPLACAAFAIVAHRAEQRAAGTPAGGVVSFTLLVGASLQLLGGAFDPNETGPSSGDLRESRRLQTLVRKLENSGEVVVTTIGGLTRAPHFHAAALYDVIRAGDSAPAEYLEGLRTQRYVAIFVGVPDEFRCDRKSCDDLSNTTLENYFVAARLEEQPALGMIGFVGRPRWILRPRKTPLTAMPRKQLEQRLRSEAGLAEMRRWAAEPGTDPMPDDDIEALAARGVE